MKEEVEFTLRDLEAAALDNLPLGALYNLSDLDREDSESFWEYWSGMSDERRKAVVRLLVEMAEDHFELYFSPLFRKMLKDPNEEVRRLAVEGLWEDEDPSLIKPLIDLLQTDESEAVRAAAATSLGKFVYLQELEELDPGRGRIVEDALLTCIRSSGETTEVRRRAIESISYRGSAEVESIIEDAYFSPEWEMKVSAVFSMGRNSNPRWEKYVLRELYSSSPELRYEAAIASGEMELRSAVERLMELALDSTDSEVRDAAIWALGKIPDIRIRRFLTSLLDVDNEDVRDAALDALSDNEITMMDDRLLRELSLESDEDELEVEFQEPDDDWDDVSMWDWDGAF
jgi:HEAT repeat protein